QAQERRDRILADLNAGRWGEQRDKTFNEAVSKWIDTHLPNLKPKSVMRYRVSLTHLLEDFDGVPLKDITSSKLSDFEARRRKAGATNPTIRRDLDCLSSLFSSCEEWEWLDSNPALGYKRKRARKGLKESPPKTRYLSLHEEDLVLEDATAILYRAAAFAIDTGLRKEEQFSLLKSDIDLVKGVINVRPEITKTTRARQVPLLPRALEIAKYLLESTRGPYLFTSPTTGKRYSEKSNTFYARLQRTAKKAGVRPLSWHDLRRTCACRLLQEHGMTMHEVSLWLGHQSIQTTERAYAFLEQEQLRRVNENAEINSTQDRASLRASNSNKK
ncbi:MAG TPA: integrase, partial [Gammaproteobacteria bacterium]|nr:integrase [Gammaproteobacteria bacterium]